MQDDFEKKVFSTCESLEKQRTKLSDAITVVAFQNFTNFYRVGWQLLNEKEPLMQLQSFPPMDVTVLMCCYTKYPYSTRATNPANRQELTNFRIRS